MSNETKREVFDKLLSEYVDDELRIDGLVYEPDQHIGELSREYFTNSYEAALTDETEKQKSCPYCHETDSQSKHAHYGEVISDKTEYFDFVRKHKLYRRVKARIKSPENDHPKLCVTQMNRFREVSVVLDKAINYCPICGRKL
ncbi:hypothetical protein [Lacticaseibacillus paracasei]|uniref:hypothetical protein n=1 Tax=Lacticaseibacillus paracasei TaxID=1597 RepID=UPI000F0B5CE3|nr:hypothetical protein [Lacticaseibacillus paracasei]RNE05604.1 hypothetical protein FAM22278_02194 [Lacticaseibacillus paracasei]